MMGSVVSARMRVVSGLQSRLRAAFESGSRRGYPWATAANARAARNNQPIKMSSIMSVIAPASRDSARRLASRQGDPFVVSRP